jgi:hypothetical protein
VRSAAAGTSRGTIVLEHPLRIVVVSGYVRVYYSNYWVYTVIRVLLLKVIRKKLTREVYANNAPVRCAIYSRDTVIRIYSVPRFSCNKPFVKIPS